jgi:ribosome-binding factor A
VVTPERSGRRYARTLRVNEVVREVIADELERCSDPRLTMVTVTGVNVSPDLRHATVFYAALGRHDDDIAAALDAAAPHLRGVLGEQVRLKYLPRLQFREDPAIEHGQRVEEILRGLNRDGGATTGTGEGMTRDE